MGTLIGIFAIIGMLAVSWVIHKAANRMHDVSQGRSGPYGHAPTSELKRRYAELNRHFDFLTDEQCEEHDRIRHVLLMRGERL